MLRPIELPAATDEPMRAWLCGHEPEASTAGCLTTVWKELKAQRGHSNQDSYMRLTIVGLRGGFVEPSWDLGADSWGFVEPSWLWENLRGGLPHLRTKDPAVLWSERQILHRHGNVPKVTPNQLCSPKTTGAVGTPQMWPPFRSRRTPKLPQAVLSSEKKAFS